MTLPSSGTLSISQINTEFGRGNNLNAYRGTTWYTDAGGSGTFSSGAISISDFYGKRATSPTFSFTISSNQTNADLRTLAVTAGWDQSTKVVATISSGVVVSANSTASTGLTISGSFPGGVELVNNGYIIGMGGAGGWGGGHNGYYPYSNVGQAGSAGGKALAVSVATTITNNGTIGGGGGGGGGGGQASNNDKFTSWVRGGGGGGGRTGSTNSAYGQAPSVGGFTAGSNGTAGTFSSQGSGGNGGSVAGATGGLGGGGGTWGSSGTGGGSGFGTGGGWSGGAAGGAGACLTGNSYITWSATGTRLGAIS